MRTTWLPPLSLLLACTGGSEPVLDDTGAVPDPLAACVSESTARTSVDLSSVRLDLSCQGPAEGTTVLLLHGFPEFWMGWAPVMDALPDDLRLVAPDQRGYNTSDKPEDLEDYELDVLVGDIRELIDLLGGEVVLVGHDWGGAVAWAVAAEHPERVHRLVIMNAPHMNVFKEELETNPEQEEAFSYVDFFVEEGTEDLLVANDFAILAGMMGEVLSAEELDAYKQAWGQERAIERGLNWYRANFEEGLPKTDRELVVDVPTKVLWGMDDTALLPSNLEGLPDYVADLEVVEVEGATHWIAHEVPEQVAQEIVDFLP